MILVLMIIRLVHELTLNPKVCKKKIFSQIDLLDICSKCLFQIHHYWCVVSYLRHRDRLGYWWTVFLLWRFTLGCFYFIFRCTAWSGSWLVCFDFRLKEGVYHSKTYKFFCDIVVSTNTLPDCFGLYVSMSIPSC